MSGISQYIPEGKTGRVTTTVAEAILCEETPLFEGGEERDRGKKGEGGGEGESALSGIKKIRNIGYSLFISLKGCSDHSKSETPEKS